MYICLYIDRYTYIRYTELDFDTYTYIYEYIYGEI